MGDATATLARSLTKTSSLQTYCTARLLVDRDLEDDFFRAYAYFRWVDDIVDAQEPARGISEFHAERIAFIRQQRDLIDSLYANDEPVHLAEEERILAALVRHDRARHSDGEPSGLQSFIRNMFAVIEFDAHRRGGLISEAELERYSDWVAASATDGLQHFIGHGHPYPTAENRYSAARAAHITHLLRDMVQDTADGFVNIPQEYLEQHAIRPQDMDSPPFRAWVWERVALARRLFAEGKDYLDGLKVLRCKIAGYWYCARFEGVLDAIERDGYRLARSYPKRNKAAAWLGMAGLALTIALRHLAPQSPQAARMAEWPLEPENQEQPAAGEAS